MAFEGGLSDLECYANAYVEKIMLTPCTVDNSAEFCDKYYSAQSGYGLSFFESQKIMEGNRTFSGLMNSALTMLRNIGKKR